MKGVVLAGGLGTRMGDLTRITNKHLLPVYDRPMIYYPIQYLVEAGIKDIMIVTGGEHAGDFLRLLRNGDQFGCRLHYAYQEGNTGIAAALKLAEGFTGDSQFCVLLGDNAYEHGVVKNIECVSKLSGLRNEAWILLAKTANPCQYGVPIFDRDAITEIQEKPKKAPTPYAVTGCYIYPPSVFDVIDMLTPSKRGELEITDVNNNYIAMDSLGYHYYDGWWIDCGTPESLLRASNLVKDGYNLTRLKEIDSAIDKDLKAVKQP